MATTLLLADPNSNAWEFANRVFAKIREKTEDFELVPLEVKKFADGEIYVHCPVNVRKRECFFIHDSSKEPCLWLSELGLVNDMLKRASAESVTDVLPYLKYARQDRKDKPRVPISARFVAEIIELDANRVITTDVHAPQIQGFFNIPLDNLYSFPIFAKYIKEKHQELIENCIIISPDAGGTERARSIAKRLDKEIALIDKRRAEANQIEEVRVIGEVEGKNFIIVDDIIDTGGTACSAARAVKEAGGKDAYLLATHGLFSRDALSKLVQIFKKIIVSDSIPKNNLPIEVEVVSLAELYAEAIYRASKGLSVSALFS